MLQRVCSNWKSRRVALLLKMTNYTSSDFFKTYFTEAIINI